MEFMLAFLLTPHPLWTMVWDSEIRRQRKPLPCWLVFTGVLSVRMNAQPDHRCQERNHCSNNLIVYGSEGMTWYSKPRTVWAEWGTLRWCASLAHQDIFYCVSFDKLAGHFNFSKFAILPEIWALELNFWISQDSIVHICSVFCCWEETHEETLTILIKEIMSLGLVTVPEV